jgi:predicted Zn-dependent protease
MLTAFVLAESLRHAPGWKWLVVPVCALVLSSAIQWLLLNHDVHRGLTRVRAFVTEAPGPEGAGRALTWDFLTTRNLQLGRWEEAADAGAHAAAAAPHRRILLMWAIAESSSGDDQASADVYRRLLAQNPEDPLAWLGLAGTARRLGNQAVYAQAMRRVAGYSPDGREARAIRRHLHYFPQVWAYPLPW